LWRVARHPDVAPTLKRWLKKEFDDQGPMWRVEAAALLWRIDKSPEAITALAEVLRHKESRERGAVLGAGIEIGPEARAALPALLPLLKDKDKNLRVSAAVALGRLGEHARPAARDLRGALDDSDAAVGLAAARALWLVGGDPGALERLRKG